ncbi:MAG: hypothetical protein GQ471_02970 [Nitrosopumilus sp.]|jgi:hypothetical protein|nr:hypothetical protein [Nitrosopumilus sp.]
MSKLVSNLDYGQFFDRVMKIDPNIRLVAAYDGQFRAKLREGIRRNLSDEEIKSSMIDAQNRWILRKNMSFKIGEPKFAMAQYGRVNRITIPLDDDRVILLTTDLGVDINELADKVIETHIRFLD